MKNTKENFIKSFQEIANKSVISNTSKGIQRALKKYKTANSAFWVTSLSYYSIMSLAPIFAILLSFGSWLGIESYIIEQVSNYSPLQDRDISLIINFSNNLLDNARNGILAGIGFISLGLTLIRMFSIVEAAFNDIWHVEKHRSYVRKISDYLSFFVFLPILMVILNAASIILIRRLNDKTIFYYIISKGFPYIIFMLFLTALYMVMPNTKVKFSSAFISAVFTSICLTIFQRVFISLQSFISTYNRIYGSFSIVFIFLIWIRIIWFLIILGGHLAYLLQNQNFEIEENEVKELSFASKYCVAIIIVKEIVHRIKENKEVITLEELRQKTEIYTGVLSHVLTVLRKSGIVIEGENENSDKIYSLTRNISTLTLNDIFVAMASSGEEIDSLRENIRTVLKYEKMDTLIVDVEVN